MYEEKAYRKDRRGDHHYVTRSPHQSHTRHNYIREEDVIHQKYKSNKPDKGHNYIREEDVIHQKYKSNKPDKGIIDRRDYESKEPHHHKPHHHHSSRPMYEKNISYEEAHRIIHGRDQHHAPRGVHDLHNYSGDGYHTHNINERLIDNHKAYDPPEPSLWGDSEPLAPITRQPRAGEGYNNLRPEREFIKKPDPDLGLWAGTHQPPGPVLSQPQTPKRPWTSSVLDCFDDYKTCCCVCCCSPFYECYVMDREFHEHCCAAWPCCGGPVLPFMAIRYKVRMKDDIEGSLLEDCFMSTCCFPCMLCQLLREVHGIHITRYKNDRSLEARMAARANEVLQELDKS